MTEALLGVGSNLGDRLATLQRAVDLLAAHGVRTIASSRVWATAPLGGPSDQPEFLNAVIRVDPGLLGVDEVLSVIGVVEAELGRIRDERWGPRTVDIDILLWGDLVRDDSQLTIPHPRLHERAFVVLPLLDLDPDPVLPDGRRLLELPAPQWRGEAGRSTVGGAVTDKVCLRCDWSGAIRDDTCPRCGAGLFSASSGKAGADAGRPAPVLAEKRTERSWRASAAAVLVVVFAVASVVIVQRHTPSGASSEAVDTGRTGFLITSAPEGDGARMWVWDLGADTAVPGPLLHRTPEELVYSYDVQAGWIGITSSVGAGLSASVLRRLGPDDRPLPVARGDAVAWVPSSSSVSVLRSRPAGACNADHRQYLVRIDPHFGRSDSTGSGAASPWPSREIGTCPTSRSSATGSPRRCVWAPGTPQPIVPGYRLLSASADGDLLVQRPGGGLELAYLARTGTTPVPIGGHGQTLDPIRVLGWSADASQAFVFGIYDNAQGIFRVTVGPQPRPRPPVLLLATNAVDLQLSATAGGDLYVATDGAVSLVHGDLVDPVSAPPGAPAPVGPVLWVATLPYSPAEG